MLGQMAIGNFSFCDFSCTQRRTSMLKEFTILLGVIVRVSEYILYLFCIAKHSLNMLKYKYDTCAAELEDSSTVVNSKALHLSTLEFLWKSSIYTCIYFTQHYTESGTYILTRYATSTFDVFTSQRSTRTLTSF